jgi:hypothetical protein
MYNKAILNNKALNSLFIPLLFQGGGRAISVAGVVKSSFSSFIIKSSNYQIIKLTP